MNSRFTVDLDELDKIVSRLNALAGFLTDHLAELDRKVATLGNGTWESAAATAYRDAHTRWAADASEFAQGVADCAEAARIAHGDYSTAVHINRRGLQSGQA